MEVERPLPAKEGMDVDGSASASAGPAAPYHGDDAGAAGGGDLYTRLKQLQSQVELTDIQVRVGGGSGRARGGRMGGGRGHLRAFFSMARSRGCERDPRAPWRAVPAARLLGSAQ
jgi:hypothetical protein